MFRTLHVAAALCVALFAAGPAAAVPSALPYVGFLADDEGPYTGTVSVSVELFDGAEGGISLWGPHTFPQVEVEGGIFTIVLGAADSPELEASLLPPTGAWLDFAIDGEPLLPRQQLLSVPYALVAGQAERSDEAAALAPEAAAGFAPALHDHYSVYVNEGQPGAITADMLAEGAVHTDAIQDQAIALGHLGPNGCAAGEAIRFDGTAWQCMPVLSGPDAEAAFASAEALALAVARLDALEASLAEQAALTEQLEATVAAQAVAIADLQGGQPAAGGCPDDMVAVGDFCIDRVEASMWRRVDGGKLVCAAVQAAVDQAKAAPFNWTDGDFAVWYGGGHPTCAGAGEKPDLCQYEQFGSPPSCSNWNSCDDYPEPHNGNFEAPLFSCAIVGVGPARACTWFQAQQACVFAGKRLCTNAEWQGAAAGTPDPHLADPGDDSEPCNIWANSKPTGSEWATPNQTTKTGSAKQCVSSHGVYDMVGNLMELTADWWGQGPNSADGNHANPDYNKDGFWNVDVAEHSGITPPIASFPATAHRGGAYDYAYNAGVFSICLTDGPSHLFHTVGYRCCSNP